MAERNAARRMDPRRSPEERAADHAELERLTTDVLPGLVARLAATGLGEVELREEGWMLRVRRPAVPASAGRRPSDGPARSQPGHVGHGHAPGALEGHRGSRLGSPATPGGTAATNGSSPGPLDDVSDGRWPDDEALLPGGTVATSPAVGIFQPRADLRPGIAVRGGERLGVVDVLGIPQEVVAPADGLIGMPLVEAGHAVEYGQELLRIELTGPGGGPDTGKAS